MEEGKNRKMHTRVTEMKLEKLKFMGALEFCKIFPLSLRLQPATINPGPNEKNCHESLEKASATVVAVDESVTKNCIVFDMKLLLHSRGDGSFYDDGNDAHIALL